MLPDPAEISSSAPKSDGAISVTAPLPVSTWSAPAPDVGATSTLPLPVSIVMSCASIFRATTRPEPVSMLSGPRVALLRTLPL